MRILLREAQWTTTLRLITENGRCHPRSSARVAQVTHCAILLPQRTDVRPVTSESILSLSGKDMEGMRSFIPASERNSLSTKPDRRNRQYRLLQDEIMTLGKGNERHCCVSSACREPEGREFPVPGIELGNRNNCYCHLLFLLCSRRVHRDYPQQLGYLILPHMEVQDFVTSDPSFILDSNYTKSHPILCPLYARAPQPPPPPPKDRNYSD